MKRGYLLMNTGSPDEPTEAALRVYLKEFLMDPYVIDLPFPLRYALVHWAILPKRPVESAEAYKLIWDGGGTMSSFSGSEGSDSSSPAVIGDNDPPVKGSPLIHYCTCLTNTLKSRFKEPVELGMAYGNPSFKQGIENLLQQGVEEICLLPMFPHYAMATFGGCVAAVKKALKGRVPLRTVPPFYLDPNYISPLAASLKDVNEHILFSYHGLPVRHLKKTDPTGSHCMQSSDCCSTPSPAHKTCYRHQCFETTKAVVKEAGISEDRYSISFQSRLGRAEWMQPYTEETLRELPQKGITELAVICPAFLCDCLETLEEIEIRGKETFMEAGGESFRMIRCLNDSDEALECLITLMKSADSWNIA
jgi:ferrochelatase